MSDTPNAGIPYVPQGTLDPAAGLNLALNVIDALIQCAVIEVGRNTPPVSPVDGDMYIVGAGSGAWSGQDDNLARYVAEGTFWQFFTAGIQVNLIVSQEDGGIYAYNATSASSGWVLAGGLPDAPSNGTSYVRKDGAWVAESASTQVFAPVVTDSTTSRTATAAQAGDYTRFTNASAKTYEFDDSESYVVGDEYHGRNVGAADLTLVEGGSMTINAPFGGSLVVPQGGTFTVKIVASDEADLMGATSP